MGHYLNRYETTFSAPCPTNGKRIGYSLTIETDGRLIMVEDIAARINALPSPAYHEDLADLLFAAFGGRQTLAAVHHGVTITTLR